MPPTARLTPGRSRWWGWFEWLGRRGAVEAAWVLSLSSFPKSSRSSASFPIHYSYGFHPFLGQALRASYVNSQLSLQRLGDEMSDEVQRHIQRIANGWPNWWAVRSGNSADPWVIAYARAFGGVVISEEQRSGRDVRIPDDCNELDVQHMNLLDLFRAEGFGRVQRNP